MATGAATAVVMTVMVMVMVMVGKLASPFAPLAIVLYATFNASLYVVEQDFSANDRRSASQRSHQIFAGIILLLRRRRCWPASIEWRVAQGSAAIGTEGSVGRGFGIAARTAQRRSGSAAV